MTLYWNDLHCNLLIPERYVFLAHAYSIDFQEYA